MPSDVTIVVADASRMSSIREAAVLPGRMMPFTTGSIGSAWESIRTYRPKIVAFDAIFAQTPQGASFIERVEQLNIPGSTVMLVLEHEGRWTAVPQGGGRGASKTAAVIAPGTPVIAAAPAVPPARAEVVSTRRVPRFPVRDSLDVTVESGCAHLVDISVLGAQVLSLPVLRPGQKLKIDLTDNDDSLNVVAQVAWSLFERPQLRVDPHYRVGLEFAGAAQQALEQYRLRHCNAHPAPPTAR
jgi:PilZ domain-containing protein